MTRVRADPTYLNDPEISEYLGRLGYQLVSHAHTSTYNFEFFAIRDETLNAFALPGKVKVNSRGCWHMKFPTLHSAILPA